MKILILNWRDTKHPLAGGAEISLFEHAKYWQKQKNEVIWFASQFPGAKKEEIIEDIKILRKGSHYTVHFWAFWFYMNHKFLNVDIVIDSFHFIPFLSILYMRKKENTIVLINEVAGKLWFFNIFAPVALMGYLVEPFIIRLYKNNDFITGSDSAKNDLISLGIPPKMINVVHHGFHLHDVSKKIKKETVPTLLFLGRVSKDKGVLDVLEVFSRVRQQIFNVQLWIVGKEERKGITNEFLRTIDSNARKNVHYLGFVDLKEKFNLLRKSWLLVHPSYKEGWGLTVIEAASQGTPTVGYNVAGLQDSVQQGKTGILVASKDIPLLTNAAIKILEDKILYAKLATNAQKWSKNFSWEGSVKKSWEVLKNVYEKNNK